MRRHWMETDKVLEKGLSIAFDQQLQKKGGKLYLEKMPTLEQLETAQKYLNRGLLAMPHNLATQKVNELMMCVVKPKGETVGMLQARCGQIASELGALPADVFLAVLNKIKQEEVFFPPLVKFIEYSKLYMINRNKMQEMITAYKSILERKSNG